MISSFLSLIIRMIREELLWWWERKRWKEGDREEVREDLRQESHTKHSRMQWKWREVLPMREPRVTGEARLLGEANHQSNRVTHTSVRFSLPFLLGFFLSLILSQSCSSSLSLVLFLRLSESISFFMCFQSSERKGRSAHKLSSTSHQLLLSSVTVERVFSFSNLLKSVFWESRSWLTWEQEREKNLEVVANRDKVEWKGRGEKCDGCCCRSHSWVKRHSSTSLLYFSMMWCEVEVY